MWAHGECSELSSMPVPSLGASFKCEAVCVRVPYPPVINTLKYIALYVCMHMCVRIFYMQDIIS